MKDRTEDRKHRIYVGAVCNVSVGEDGKPFAIEKVLRNDLMLPCLTLPPMRADIREQHGKPAQQPDAYNRQDRAMSVEKFSKLLHSASPNGALTRHEACHCPISFGP